MRERTKIAYMAIFVIALVVAGGCGKRGNTFEISRLGFSMELPPGWKQGEPRVIGGYRVSSRGEFFFENADYDDPSGSVMEFPLMGGSLTEYVDNLIGDTEATEKLQAGLLRTLDKITGEEFSEGFKEAESALETRVISKTPKTVSGHEAIEVLTEAPRTILTLYVRRGDEVIWVTCGAPKEDFPKYEQLFRNAVETIKIR